MASSSQFRKLRNVLIHLGVIIILIALTSPLAVISLLQTASSEKFNAGFSQSITNVLRWVQRLSPTASQMMLQYLPTVILLALNATLLFLLYAAGRYLESPLSGVRRELNILTPSYVYLTFNILVVPTLVLSSATALFKLIVQEHSLALLGRVLLDNTGGAFFIVYILQRTFLGALIQLYRPFEWLYQKWLLARAVTRKEHEEAMERWPYEFGQQLAVQLAIFTVCLCLGTMVPMLYLCGPAYFIVKHFVDKWLLNCELADMFEDSAVHPTQLEERHAWAVDQDSELKRRGRLSSVEVQPRSGLGVLKEAGSEGKAVPDTGPSAGMASRASAAGETKDAPRHGRVGSAGSAMRTPRKRDPSTAGPLSHYAGRVAHRAYGYVPMGLLFYNAVMAGFFSIRGTNAQVTMLLVGFIINCLITVPWFWNHFGIYFVPPAWAAQAAAAQAAEISATRAALNARPSRRRRHRAPARGLSSALPRLSLFSLGFTGDEQFASLRNMDDTHMQYRRAYKRVDLDISAELASLTADAAEETGRRSGQH